MEAVSLKRRLTAILLADIVGYSRLMSTDEEDTHSRFTGYIAGVIDPKIAEYGGRPVRSMGDGLLVEFDSAIDAVRCAVDIQRALADGEAEVAQDRRIRLRIGINTGDVIVEERDIYGHSVNVAARLEALAGPGEIFVTQSVCDQLRGYPALSFSDQGDHHLKNIEHPVRAFRVDYSAAPQPASRAGRLMARWQLARYQLARRPRSAIWLGVVLLIVAGFLVGAIPNWHYAAQLPRASIVVLPFRNLSSDPSQDYLADAITDDLTTDLSRVPGAFVIASATAFTYKGRRIDAREVGREVGVRYLLEGNVQKLGDKVQINAQLIDTASGAAIWGDRFVKEVKDIWELQAAVTGRIAVSLDIQLAQAESRRAVEERAADPNATDLRYRAMGLYFSGITPEHTLAARQLLEQAVKLDPRSAESWGWLALLVVSDYLQGGWNHTGKDQLGSAADAVRHALAIDPKLALAYQAEGFVYRAQGDHQLALDAFTQAVTLNPNYARAYAQVGNELINVGRPDEAPPMVEKAVKLRPHDPSLGIFYWVLGRSYFYGGRYADAIPWLRKSIELLPSSWYNRLFLVSAYALTEQKPQAAKTLAEFDKLPEFAGYTVARAMQRAAINPGEAAVIVEGRKKLEQGLLAAGMAAH